MKTKQNRKDLLNLPIHIPSLQVIGNGFYKHSAQGPVYHSVIITMGQVHLTPDSNKVAFLGFYYGRHFTYRPQGQDAHLGLIDNWRAKNAAKGTNIGYGIGLLPLPCPPGLTDQHF